MGETLPQKLPVHPVFHVAEHNIRLGSLSGRQNLHGQLRASDSAADQSRVENQSFHKTILGAAQCLVLGRFVHAPHGVGTAVQTDAGVITVYQKTGNSGKEIFYQIILFRYH